MYSGIHHISYHNKKSSKIMLYCLLSCSIIQLYHINSIQKRIVNFRRTIRTKTLDPAHDLQSQLIAHSKTTRVPTASTRNVLITFPEISWKSITVSWTSQIMRPTKPLVNGKDLHLQTYCISRLGRSRRPNQWTTGAYRLPQDADNVTSRTAPKRCIQNAMTSPESTENSRSSRSITAMPRNAIRSTTFPNRLTQAFGVPRSW